jgi:glycosyltransferase involved in cell wall biosynthesis
VGGVPLDGPAVDVVVPLYDSEAYLAECLESILAQTYRPLEVIAVDDGSSDGSVAVAEAFPGVRLLRGPHAGVSQARNAGLAAATSTLVAFCDADDRWRPTKVERQVAHLDRYPEAAGVLCRCEVEIEPGADEPPWLAPDLVYGDRGGIQPLSGLFRRSLLDDLGGFRGDDGAEDLDLLFRARELGARFDVIPEPLAVRRVHERNALRQFGSSAPGMFNRIRDHLQRVEGTPPT